MDEAKRQDMDFPEQKNGYCDCLLWAENLSYVVDGQTILTDSSFLLCQVLFLSQQQ